MPLPTAGVVITMAGNGERFRKAGYALPKFKIEVRGHTLFHWAVRSLRAWIEAGSEFIFAARREHAPDAFIAREAESLGIGRYEIVRLDHPTDGQATTALIAGRHLSRRDAPVVIYNIDTYVEPEALSPSAARGDGWIPCFPGKGDAWSFARADEGGRVQEVAEKRRIAPHASIGLYWFRSFDLYSDCYVEHFSGERRETGERYIAPMYNTLIARSGEVRLTLLPESAVHPLGTPEQVEAFQR
jgi:NDP-sugar pyrophosphorylase family protein